MSSSMSFFMLGVNQRLNKNNMLLRLSRILDWSEIEKVLRNIHINDLDYQGYPDSYDNLKMFKAILLQEWYSLSDRELEEALSLRIDFMVFTGFELGENAPDHNTISKFRNLLKEKSLDKVLFNEINKQLKEKGITIKPSNGALTNVTIIESA